MDRSSGTAALGLRSDRSAAAGAGGAARAAARPPGRLRDPRFQCVAAAPSPARQCARHHRVEWHLGHLLRDRRLLGQPRPVPRYAGQCRRLSSPRPLGPLHGRARVRSPHRRRTCRARCRDGRGGDRAWHHGPSRLRAGLWPISHPRGELERRSRPADAARSHRGSEPLRGLDDRGRAGSHRSDRPDGHRRSPGCESSLRGGAAGADFPPGGDVGRGNRYQYRGGEPRRRCRDAALRRRSFPGSVSGKPSPPMRRAGEQSVAG